jgi:hypothetical protein
MFIGKKCVYAALALSAAASAATRAPLFLTATNATANYLAIINTNTKQTLYVPTGGMGGVPSGSNAGGVAVSGEIAAVINYGSSNVSIFERRGDTMQPTQMIKTVSKPVSVAFGLGHLVVLELTTAESFPVYGSSVSASADGSTALLANDGSAGQIITYDGGAMYTETSGTVAWVNLSTDGAGGLSGTGTQVMLPPAPNNNTPLGLIGRGANVYLTIAHSDLEALVVNGRIVSMAEGPTPFVNSTGGLTHAPCWNALSGQFLFAADSPGKQLVRFLVSDTNVFLDKAAVATLTGSPTDLAAAGSLLGVIDGGDGTTSNVSLFGIDSEGELTLRFAVKIANPINGAALVE